MSLNYVLAAVVSARCGRSVVGRTDVANGPHYRRGDEPARVVCSKRLRAVLTYCRAVDCGLRVSDKARRGLRLLCGV